MSLSLFMENNGIWSLKKNKTEAQNSADQDGKLFRQIPILSMQHYGLMMKWGFFLKLNLCINKIIKQWKN